MKDYQEDRKVAFLLSPSPSPSHFFPFPFSPSIPTSPLHYLSNLYIDFNHYLCRSFKAKLSTILVDTHFNSRTTVLLNIYQNFLLVSIKFHCYQKSLHYRLRQYFALGKTIHSIPTTLPFERL